MMMGHLQRRSNVLRLARLGMCVSVKGCADSAAERELTNIGYVNPAIIAAH